MLHRNLLTVFKNHRKCRIWVFHFLASSINFWPIKIHLCVTLFDRKLQVIKNLPKWTISLVMFNVTFLRNFQTLCLLFTYLLVKNFCHWNSFFLFSCFDCTMQWWNQKWGIRSHNFWGLSELSELLQDETFLVIFKQWWFSNNV